MIWSLDDELLSRMETRMMEEEGSKDSCNEETFAGDAVQWEWPDEDGWGEWDEDDGRRQAGRAILELLGAAPLEEAAAAAPAPVPVPVAPRAVPRDFGAEPSSVQKAFLQELEEMMRIEQEHPGPAPLEEAAPKEEAAEAEAPEAEAPRDEEVPEAEAAPKEEGGCNEHVQDEDEDDPVCGWRWVQTVLDAIAQMPSEDEETEKEEDEEEDLSQSFWDGLLDEEEEEEEGEKEEGH